MSTTNILVSFSSSNCCSAPYMTSDMDSTLVYIRGLVKLYRMHVGKFSCITCIHGSTNDEFMEMPSQF